MKPLRSVCRSVGKRIGKREAETAAHIPSDPEYARRYEILRSIPGIGPVNAAMLCCWMPGLGHIEHRQAASLLGVAPFAKNSGMSSGARHICGGRRRPHNAMYMAATSAARHNPDMNAVHDRL